MNWGIANAVPQGVIAPTADIRERERRGDPVPARPDWMCITSPEYSCGNANLDHYKAEKSIEELEAIEAARLAKEEARRAVMEERQRLAEAARERGRAMKAAEKLAREERAKANKAAGFGKKKPDEKPVYVPLGRAHKKDWA